MNIEQLKAMGGLVPSSLIRKEVKWTNAEGEAVAFSVFVRRMTYGESISVFKDAGDSEGEVNQAAWKIAACIRLGENGEERLSYEDAMNLDLGLGLVLNAVCNEVNGFGGEAKNSQPPTNSGANSSSRASAAKPSRKRSRT